MTRRLAMLAAGLASCTLVTLTSNAQPPESVIVDVGACVDIESRGQRLECYEARVTEILRVREFEQRAQRASEQETSRVGRAPTEPEPVTRTPVEPVPVATASRQPTEVSRQATEERPEVQVAPSAEPSPVDAGEQPSATTASEEPDDTAGEIVATVTSLREMEPNAYLIFLDNDQVWRQNRPKRYALLPGAKVTLRPTRWGPSYRLTDPNLGSFIQVERVR